MNQNVDLPSELDQAGQMLFAENYPQAELYLRRYLRFGGQDPIARNLLAAVSQAYGVSDTFRLSETTEPPTRPQYLLIKAWGYGFWSDVHHVMGQALLAELTHRTPIVQWGDNSLFSDGHGGNAFELYFEPLSEAKLSELPTDASIYPPKWTRDNLQDNNVNKWTGPHALLAAQYLLNRDEEVVVSDFYMTVSSLRPWIGPDSRYFGLSDDDIYLELFAKYLRPLPDIRARVEQFYQTHMQGRHWVAVHIRGSDKIYESSGLHQTNEKYAGFIDRIIEINPGIGIFLLTDSVDVHTAFNTRYAGRVVTTPALRSNSNTGVHMQGHSGRTVGDEVLIDALLAARCDYFVGNQESNVSLAIASLKRWPQGFLFMLGDKSGRSENLYLHKSPPVDVQKCRLCQSPVRQVFSKLVLGRHNVNYHRCLGCGALQTDTPHWLDEAYSGPAELYDTGKASRTLVNFLALPPLLKALNVRKTDLAVDFGGGTGLLARLLRDTGYNFHTCDKFGSSEFMGAYAWNDLDHPCKLVTLFEVAEHFSDPATEWQHIFASDPDWVIGSTSLYTGQDQDWVYLSCESGQHIFFYSTEAIDYVAKKAGRYAYHLGMYFLITRSPLDDATLRLITGWRDNLFPACQASFSAWAQGPYRQASEDNAEVTAYARLRQSGRRIALDGTFFRYASGISRVWKSILRHWSASSLGQSILVIDRGRTAPRLPGISYVDAPLHDFAQPEQDRQMLQAICDRENIGLFISTYYTIPLITPSALLVLDMIPEVMGFDLTNPQWVAKRHAIEYAQAFLSISQSTEQDLVRFYPGVQATTKAVTYCGCDFRAASTDQVASFKQRHGIQKPYFLISGGRSDYKNAVLFFRAFERLGERRADYAIVCTNANQPLEAEVAIHVGAAEVHMLVLSDADLQCAYSGAIALAYPSRYEGFGLPVAEAMACACPVITCRISSLPEVGGEAVIYVDPDSIDQMHQALLDVQDATTRADLVARGRLQAERFSWSKMSREVGQSLAIWAASPHRPIP
jgi:glycosyltransferase involved in cell wall biosynthesis